MHVQVQCWWSLALWRGWSNGARVWVQVELAELRRGLQEQEQLIRGYQVSKAATCAGRHSQQCLQQNCQLCASVWVDKRDAYCLACCFVLSLIDSPHGSMLLSNFARWLHFSSSHVARAASDCCARQRRAALLHSTACCCAAAE